MLETLGAVYHVDAEARAQRLAAEARLQRHQEQSAPLLMALHAWCVAQLEDRRVEPNSGLGQAIACCLKHWERLTLFPRRRRSARHEHCRASPEEGDSPSEERSLLQDPRGTEVRDLYMSLIHTADLARVNAVNYLTELQQHAADLARTPSDWMPWNYRETRVRCASPAPAPAQPH